MIETDRLILKPISMDDVPGYQAAFDHPDFYFVGAKKLKDNAVAYVSRRLELFNDNENSSRPISISMSIFLRETPNKAIGYFNAGGNHLIEALEKYGLEIGYFMHPDYQNQGLTTEALNTAMQFYKNKYETTKFYGTVAPDNMASIKVMVNNGFKKVEELNTSDVISMFKAPRHVYAVELS